MPPLKPQAYNGYFTILVKCLARLHLNDVIASLAHLTAAICCVFLRV